MYAFISLKKQRKLVDSLKNLHAGQWRMSVLSVSWDFFQLDTFKMKLLIADFNILTNPSFKWEQLITLCQGEANKQAAILE